LQRVWIQLNLKEFRVEESGLEIEEFGLEEFKGLGCTPRAQWLSFRKNLEKVEEEEINKDKNSFFLSTPVPAPVPAFYQWEIYYGQVDKRTKPRPFLIVQQDRLNRAVQLGFHPSILVVPLSSRLSGGAFRLKILKREKLKRDSELVFPALGVVSVEIIWWEKGVIAKLTPEEQKIARFILASLFGLDIDGNSTGG